MQSFWIILQRYIVDNSGGGTDWILFNSSSKSIDRTRLSFHQDGDDLLIRVDGDSTQQVRVYKHFDASGNYAIDYVQPSDGYGISAASISAMLTPLSGTQSIAAPMAQGGAEAMRQMSMPNLAHTSLAKGRLGAARSGRAMGSGAMCPIVQPATPGRSWALIRVRQACLLMVWACHGGPCRGCR